MFERIAQKCKDYIEKIKLNKAKELEEKKQLIMTTLLRPMTRAEVESYNITKTIESAGGAGGYDTELTIKREFLWNNRSIFSKEEYEKLANHIESNSDRIFTR